MVGTPLDGILVSVASNTLGERSKVSKVPNIEPCCLDGMAFEAQHKVEGIRVDVPTYLAPDDYNTLTDLCVLFDDGRRCHMGVGESRIFLVHPSHVAEANEILKKYKVEIVNGKQAKPGDRH